MTATDTIQTAPVSGLQNNYQEVLKQVADGPVLLLESSQLAAVLISPAEWNAIAARLKRLKELELLLEAKRRNAEMERDPAKVVSHEELKRKLAEKARLLNVETRIQSRG